MKKMIFFMSITIVLASLLIGCSSKNSIKGKPIKYKEIYSQVIGFSEKDDTSKPIKQDAQLLMTNEAFHNFKDKYFTPRQIPIEEPAKDKAVLYLQIPSDTSAVNMYKVESLLATNNTLTVKLKNIGAAMVKATMDFDGTFKCVIFLEMDKTLLKENMVVQVKK